MRSTCLWFRQAASAVFVYTLPLFALQAQMVKTPVSAADPYGVDFSSITGNVKQVTEYRGADIDVLSIHLLETYDKNKIVSSYQYDDGTPRSVIKYTYADSGQMTSITGTDTNGNVRWKYVYSYDKYGRQIGEKALDTSDAVEWRTSSKYSGGYLREKTTYNDADEITMRQTFQYDANGFLLADISQYPDGKLIKRIIYAYTKGGHIAQETYYDAAGYYERVGYTYADDGKIVSFSNIGKDYKINSKTLLWYGINGKISREKITSQDKSVTDITYYYDNSGNWIWKYDGKTYTLRKIIYGQ